MIRGTLPTHSHHVVQVVDYKNINALLNNVYLVDRSDAYLLAATLLCLPKNYTIIHRYIVGVELHEDVRQAQGE